MRHDGKRARLVVVALAGACSAPDPSVDGFISLGRDSGAGIGGTVGAAPATGGVVATGGSPVGGDGGTGGSMISVGGTVGQGGTSTDGNGGTANFGGDVNGGTSMGGGGPTCGSGGMPVVPEPNSGGAALIEACGQAGPNQRICMADGYVAHCGVTPIVLEQCAPGTCASGCCHATSDPCPAVPGIFDCAGDCDVSESCTQAPNLDLAIGERAFQMVRVGGANTMGEQCGERTRRYFELFLAGGEARVMVSPPWMLAESLTCADAPDSLCAVSEAGSRFVVIMTDADPPPPRNVIIEAHERAVLTCPPEY